jgi:ABC-type uncharacterized transport system ATPase subunit
MISFLRIKAKKSIKINKINLVGLTNQEKDQLLLTLINLVLPSLIIVDQPLSQF